MAKTRSHEIPSWTQNPGRDLNLYHGSRDKGPSSPRCEPRLSFSSSSFDTPSVSRWFTERKIFSVLIKMLWCLRKSRHVGVFRQVIKFRGGELWKIRRNNFNRGKKYVCTLPWKNETLEGGVFVSIIYGFFFPPILDPVKTLRVYTKSLSTVRVTIWKLTMS